MNLLTSYRAMNKQIPIPSKLSKNWHSHCFFQLGSKFLCKWAFPYTCVLGQKRQVIVY